MLIEKYLSLVFSKVVEYVFVNWVIAKQDLISFSNQTNNEWRFSKNLSVLTTEEVNLILGFFHGFDVFIEGNEAIGISG
jgi:hypothetical protein